ncbi:MAG: chemotaxis protein CheB [Thermodesulfovibrionales bacterium]
MEKQAAGFPVVGIGASAGGLEAFTQLFENLPADTGMAFVLVQHLAASHESMLTELLSKATSMPVKEVRDGMEVELNNVYVIPPNTEMAILHGVLHLLPREDRRGLHMPVDSFLQSLAEDLGGDAIAVIMSGTGSDGSQGVRAIKAEGGLVFAQEEASAKYAGMPGSAIATGCVDIILPPEGIAGELARISRHFSYPALVKPGETGRTPEEEGGAYDLGKLFLMLRTATGVDFTYYKAATILRRIRRRMFVHRIDKMEDYIKYVRENPTEVELLYQDILINVTSFFREPETCDRLKSLVFPQIAGKALSDVPLRLWVPGCATGEEAYSLAICLLEFLDDRKISRPIQMFATDIDEAAIEKARKGLYPESISKEVSSERLRRFFIKTEAGYQISKAIREMCIFARQNLVKDPPFSKIDLISCRNLLIYFGTALQNKALPIMHYALNPTGFLMLGTSESVGEFSSLFNLVDTKNKIYSKGASLSRLHFERPREDYAREKTLAANTMDIPGRGLPDIQKAADSIILNRYNPAGVVINADMKIIQFKGNTGPYLEHAPGAASLDIMKLCRKDLMVELNRAIQKARNDDAPAKKEGIRFNYDGQVRTVDIEVIPFKAPGTKALCFVVLFEEIPPSAPLPAKQGMGEVTHPDSEEIIQLRQELDANREYLKAISSEHEAATEEAMALNEELQSSNEEMQSINEELETAKEELQSTNEELTTVNDELQSRSEETTLVNNDLINILSGLEIPVILLGAELQIRRFNAPAGKILNLIPSDTGRPITDIRTNVSVPDLKEIIAGVIETLAVKQQEIQDIHGRWYSMTIRPYKTVDNRIEGVLMTLVDINELKLLVTERERLIHELQDSLAKVKQLSGMLPICASCKKIRDDKGYWSQVETYVSNHSEAVFTSGICPDCEKKAYEVIEKMKKEDGLS